MSEIDKIKEELGWLKIVFGLLLVTNISLVGWIVRNIFNIHVLFLLTAIIIINQRAYEAIGNSGGL